MSSSVLYTDDLHTLHIVDAFQPQEEEEINPYMMNVLTDIMNE